MGTVLEIPQTHEAQEKSSHDVLARDVAGSSTPESSTMGVHCPEVASPLDRNSGSYQTSTAKGALASSATGSAKDIGFGGKDLHPHSEIARPPPAYIMPSSSLPQPQTVKKALIPIRIVRLWEANRSCMLVVISSFFGSAMALSTKMLELDDGGMHPFQILFMRMAVTTIGCTAYLWWKRMPHSLLGQKGVRGLLLFRGVSGFFGILGIWTAIQFLSLADATVITFLTPSIVGLFSAIFLHQPYPRKEQLASLIALLGVIFIARPSFLFDHLSYPPSSGGPSHPIIEVTPVSTMTGDGPSMTQASSKGDETAAHRLTGILLALLSAVGGAGAFIAIKQIGDRAHVLTTTNFFSACCTVISAAVLAMAPLIGYGQPQLHFGLPQGVRQWVLVSSITFCGFLTQWCLTIGVSSEGRSNKAPAMVYTGMLWTVGFDQWFFGQNMSWSSFLGCALIVGSAIWVILMPKSEGRPKEADDIENDATARGLEAIDTDTHKEGYVEEPNSAERIR
ncbi:hypothetical protein VM1G_11506 [Cytospora mali]|uniref:EamA domain-containing protein n=1 Tax=Cytospora mali TaxID=578113 RepID=A0A194VVQ7_CYTMA|nr:hypothetical protein VM1G_11506 [Valsa mali]